VVLYHLLNHLLKKALEMHISEILKSSETSLSFEFFPPNSAKSNNDLFATISNLTPLMPSFVSVTYGAGGSTRQFTHELLLKLKKNTKLTIVAHLTCVGHSKTEIKTILEQYLNAGITNVMVLRGDPPKDKAGDFFCVDGFRYAYQMVEYIKKQFPQIGIGVAGFPEGHPETPNRLLELDYLKQKVDAGADYICTQLFFDNRDFYDFCERCEIIGIRVPIIAGIMPITSIKGMKRMAELAQGSRFPAKLLRLLNRADGDDSVERAGIHWASEQVRDLIDNKAKGIHFYTLNKSNATKTIYESVGLKNALSLQTKGNLY